MKWMPACSKTACQNAVGQALWSLAVIGKKRLQERRQLRPLMRESRMLT